MIQTTKICYTVTTLKADPEEKLKAFFKQTKPQLYKKGEVILRGEEIPNGIFFLSKGFVKNYSLSENGDEFTFIIYRNNDFFPIAWTFNNTREPYFIETITPCVIYKKDKQEFLNFLKENPEILLYIIGKIIRRFDGLLERMEHMAFGNAYKKVCSILFILSERFGKETSSKNIMISMPITHKDLASLLGVARETVSIEIAKLKKDNIIKSAGKYTYITNIKKLKEDSLIS